MTNTLEKELAFAKDVAKKAWGKIGHYYDEEVERTIKEDGSPVTLADKESNDYILNRIENNFPGDSIVSEEAASSLEGKRTWYIDPIDGTSGFMKRNGQFAIHIGLCIDKNPVLGVVYWPIADETYWGINSRGAYRENSRGITPLLVKQAGITTAIMDKPNAPRDLVPLFKNLGVKQYHSSGSEGLRLMKIAENKAQIRINESLGRVSTWDVCAPHAILLAAGGYVSYLDGSSLLYEQQRTLEKRYIATLNKNIADKVVESLRNV